MSTTTNPAPQDWFMYHGGYGHGGYVEGGAITCANLDGGKFGLLHSVTLSGSILSVPAVVDGEIYVGVANLVGKGAVGGAVYKVGVATGTVSAPFTWGIDLDERDSHGFTGMGCTPTVLGGFVYFIGFNATVYCLRQDDLSLVWSTNLRHADSLHNQPMTNTEGMYDVPPNPPAAGWSSPMVLTLDVDGAPKTRLYCGVGEGENPALFSFVVCLDAATGDVEWIYCTCQYEEGQHNPVNQLPAQVLGGAQEATPTPPPPFTVYDGPVVTRGCSVWSAIAYDEGTGLLYATTGQPAIPNNNDFDTGLPSVGWSSGILALDAATGEFKAFTQMPASTTYRPTDLDVDIGSSCTLYNLPSGRRVAAVGCKNGGFMVCDATTLELLGSTSLLPRTADGQQIPRVDPHPPGDLQNALRPSVTNAVSNINPGENYFGPFNTAAIHPPSGTLFVAIGGPNYHMAGPGLDSASTPHMKAIDWETLADDKWPKDNQDPPHYTKVGDSMYKHDGESGLSSPAVVNDVVFVSTSGVAIYAYDVHDGTLKWSAPIGQPSGGLNGGYGYCLGPAIWGDYVVAGALVLGSEDIPGGLLNIYGFQP